jgi:TolB-like protein
VQRWERSRGLPVRRLPGGEKAAVYVLRSELDAWRRRDLSGPPARVVNAAPPPASGFRSRPPSIAVLPFEDMSSERDQEYLCDGLTDEVINSLSRVPGIRVVARTSAFVFKHKAMDVREIGRQLNARAVLEGGLQRSDRKLRITVQLIDTQDGYHLWSERFEGTLDDVFALEDIIARATAEKLRDPSSASVYAARQHTTNPEAYRLCLQGRHFSTQVTRDGYLAAIECYRRAIERDPLCARAWAGLADCYWDGAEVGCLAAAEDLANGRHAALRAVELDPLLAEAHATLGVLRGVCDFDWVSAEREFKEGLRLHPASPVVHARYAVFFLQAHHRMHEAVAHMRSALEVDPLSPLLHASLAHLFVLGRQYDQAAEEAHHALALQPGYTAALAMLGMIYAFQGKYQELIDLGSRMPPLSEDNPVLLGGSGWALAVAGHPDRARQILLGLKAPGRYGRTPSWSIAWIHQGLGETDEALTWLERAVKEHDPKVVFIPTKPFWDSLRPHPRFQAILREMGLPFHAAPGAQFPV